MVDTVRLGGIKLSGELVQLDFLETKAPDSLLLELLHRTFSAKVNIPHLHQGYVHGGIQTSLCIPAEEFSGLQFEASIDASKCTARLLPSVGTISLYPHGRDISFAAKVLHSLSINSIPVYGMSTSVSALVLHTDFSILDEAVEQILKVCHLPENHSPLRPVIVLGDEIIETVAVYWEPKIRIYGMDLQKGLTDVRIPVMPKNRESAVWYRCCASQAKFKMVSLVAHQPEQVSVSFIVDADREKNNLSFLKSLTDDMVDSAVVCTEGVEMVSFHGPHFQDRYGIANMAFTQLHENNFNILKSGFTGTSVHLLFAEGHGEAAMKCLAEKFVVPATG